MNKFLVAIFFLLCGSTSVFAQSSVDIDGNFSQVILKGSIRAEIIPSNSSRVSITLNGTDPKRVHRSMKDGKLTIIYRFGAMETSDCIDVKIYSNDLTYLGIEGVTVVSDEAIESPVFKIETLGGINNIDLNVSLRNLDLNIGGAGKTIIRGVVEEVTVNAYLGAQIDCSECKAQRASVVAKQRAEVDIRVTGDLYAEATMGSNIFYLGNPPHVDSKTKSGGGIIAVETPE